MLVNAAREPEVVDLADCLVAMGADIEGIGTRPLASAASSGCMARAITDHRPTASRPEPMRIAAAITGGDVELIGARLDLMAVGRPRC